MIFDMKQSARKAAACGFAFALLVGVAAGCGGDASAIHSDGDLPAGKKVISGGFAVTGELPGGAYACQSFPLASGSWTAAINNTFVNPQTVTVYATCALAT